MLRLNVGSRVLLNGGCNDLRPCGFRSGPRVVRQTFVDACHSVQLRTASTQWNIPGKSRPHGELFFFLIQKKPVFVPDSEAFNSFMGMAFDSPELKGF